MRSATAHTQAAVRRRGGRCTHQLALLAVAILAMCALAPAPAAAADEPLITQVAMWEFGSEIRVGGRINPGELETTYTIQVECPDHALCQHTEDTLPAGDEARIVWLKLTDPQRGGTYQLTLTAHNADGKSSASQMLKLPATREEPRTPRLCIVPALKGDTLTAARRALAKAHCRLGVVHRPAHHHGTLRVTRQSAPAGEQLAHGARVILTLGAKRASRRGKERP